MATSKTAKVKSPLSELIGRVEQLGERVRNEREKQMNRLESQIGKAREALTRQLDGLNIDKLKDLQETYREKAEDAIRTQVSSVRKAVGDAGDHLRDSRAAQTVLKAELNALHFAAKQAEEVARVLGKYEKQVQKQLSQVELKLGKAAGAARKGGKKAKPAARKTTKAATPDTKAKATTPATRRKQA